jgi:hypothetical protein
VTAPKTKKRPVVVTTEHRGVFFGHLNGEDAASKVVTLTDVQMCVYWSADVNGVLGLASSGPSKSCRVTPAVPKITLQGVTAVMDATTVAEAAWRARPWQ